MSSDLHSQACGTAGTIRVPAGGEMPRRMFHQRRRWLSRPINGGEERGLAHFVVHRRGSNIAPTARANKTMLTWKSAITSTSASTIGALSELKNVPRARPR